MLFDLLKHCDTEGVQAPSSTPPCTKILPTVLWFHLLNRATHIKNMPLEVYKIPTGFVKGEYLTAVQRLELLQHWTAEGQRPAQRGWGWVAYADDGLHMGTDFEEKDPFTSAERDGQRLFELGSVAEFFVHPDQSRCGEYWEIHVTPNNKMTDVKVQDRDEFLSGKESYETARSFSSGVKHMAEARADGWVAQVIIPWEAFGLMEAPKEGAKWGFSICRYNYPGKLEDPELSSTTAHTKLSYHRIEEFRVLQFCSTHAVV